MSAETSCRPYERRKPKQLDQPVQLIVEGADAWGFWTGITRRLRVDSVQIHDFGGIDQLGSYLRAIRETPGFDEYVGSLVVGRDAEKDAQAALQSVQTALGAARLPVPSEPLVLHGERPRVGIMIWPAPTKPERSRVWCGEGTLEDLCLACVSPEDLVCAKEFLRCVERSGQKIRRPAKSLMHAYLAGSEHAGQSLCDATASGAWNLTADALRPFLSLLDTAIRASGASVRPGA